MIYSSSSPTAERDPSSKTREEAVTPEALKSATRQFKVLQSRAAPAQLSLPLGGFNLSPIVARTGSAAGKTFRTA